MKTYNLTIPTQQIKIGASNINLYGQILNTLGINYCIYDCLVKDKYLFKLDLSVRAFNCLRSLVNINTTKISEFITMHTKAEFQNTRCYNKRTLSEVIEEFKNNGFIWEL